jgi:hypothetical protein
MYPIDRVRLGTHVVVIRLNELPSGFRVLSAEAVSIESLPKAHMKHICENILSNQTNEPEEIYCGSLFEVESIDAASRTSFLNGYSFGMYSNLAAIQNNAATLSRHQAYLIQMLNKEL